MNDTVLIVMVCVWTSVKYLNTLLTRSLILGTFLHLNSDCWHLKWWMFFLRVSVNVLIAVLTVSVCLHILIIFGNIVNVFAPIWFMGNVSSIIFILFCRLYFVSMSKKLAPINLGLHSITLFWQLKVLQILGWKSSVQSGNTDHCFFCWFWLLPLSSFVGRFG